MVLNSCEFARCHSEFDKLFFFKQKTAYEMRISDWSSDVCASDLTDAAGDAAGARLDAENAGDQRVRYAELILGAFENIALILQQRNTFANPRIIDAARIPGPGFGAFRRLLFLHDQLWQPTRVGQIGRAHV